MGLPSILVASDSVATLSIMSSQGVQNIWKRFCGSTDRFGGPLRGVSGIVKSFMLALLILRISRGYLDDLACFCACANSCSAFLSAFARASERRRHLPSIR